MKPMYYQLFTFLTTALRATASSDNLNPNGNGFNPFWHTRPLWNGPGNTPLQLQNPAMAVQEQQGLQMGWPNPYIYQPFPPPGFMPGPAAYFGNFAPPAPVNPYHNTEPINIGENGERSYTSESKNMAVDDGIMNQIITPGPTHNGPWPRILQVNAVTGPSQPHRPVQN
ncbi:hypothetical protein F5146DRAFT_1005548 [Armillaria mellea]|nr:hypothetical protein F5146DRAFT_1005548 [Armillaria mellea]